MNLLCDLLVQYDRFVCHMQQSDHMCGTQKHVELALVPSGWHGESDVNGFRTLGFTLIYID